MQGAGWVLILILIFGFVAYGMEDGLLIVGKHLEPGERIGPSLGRASRDPESMTLYCRYLKWTGTVERVYAYSYADPLEHTSCPWILEEKQEEVY